MAPVFSGDLLLRRFAHCNHPPLEVGDLLLQDRDPGISLLVQTLHYGRTLRELPHRRLFLPVALAAFRVQLGFLPPHPLQLL